LVQKSEHALTFGRAEKETRAQFKHLNIFISHVLMIWAFGISSSKFTRICAAKIFTEHTPLLALIEWVNPEDACSGQLSNGQRELVEPRRWHVRWSRSLIWSRAEKGGL